MNLEKYPLEKEKDDILISRLKEECAEVITEASEAIKHCSKFLRFRNKKDLEEVYELIEAMKDEMKDVEIIKKEVKRRFK